MADRFRRLRHPGTALRNYAAATLLNLALVSTVLTPPVRAQGAQTRVVRDARRFRETELVPLGDGEVGVLSMPYGGSVVGTAIGAN